MIVPNNTDRMLRKAGRSEWIKYKLAGNSVSLAGPYSAAPVTAAFLSPPSVVS